MLAILWLIFPIIKSFLGENLIEKYWRKGRHSPLWPTNASAWTIDADVKVLG